MFVEKENNKIIVAGIGTDVGKTVISAILTEAFGCTYWKPVQAGDLHYSDSMKIREYCSPEITILPEKYRLNTPASPHLAAGIDGVEIQLEDIKIPETEDKLLIEGAGGLMVPLNNKGDLYIDWIRQTKLPVVLVSGNYLGSINHTILSLEVLKSSGIEVSTIVFNGDSVPSSEEAILQRFPVKKVIRIPRADDNDLPRFVKMQARILTESGIDIFSR